MADVDIVIDANASGAVSETDEASAAIRRMRREIKGVGTDARRTNRQLDAFADEAERMNRVSMILGGTLGDVTGGLDDFATLLRGGAGLVTALGAAAVVAAAGVASLGTAIVSTLANASDYIDKLSEMDRDAWDTQIDAALEAESAIAGVTTQIDRFTFAVSAEAAPAVTQFADALSGLLFVATESTSVLDGLASMVWSIVEVASPTTAAFVDVGKAVRVSAEETDKATKALEEYQAAASKSTGRRDEDDGPLIDKAAVAGMEAMARAVGEYATGLSFVSEELVNAQMNQRLLNEEMMGTEEARHRHMELAWEQFNLDKVVAEGQVDNERRTFAERVENANQWVALADQTANQIAAIGNFVADAAIKSEKKAAKARLAMQLVQAITGTALAVVNALQVTPIYVGIALAALAAAAGGIQIGIISNQIAKLHRGGLQQDETMMGNTTVLHEERSVVLTRDAQRAIGGESGMARINAGNAPSQDTAVTFVIEGETTRARQLAAPDPGYAQWSPA